MTPSCSEEHNPERKNVISKLTSIHSIASHARAAEMLALFTRPFLGPSLPPPRS